MGKLSGGMDGKSRPPFVFYADCAILVRRHGRREEEVVRVLVVIALSLGVTAVPASSEGE